MTNPDLTLPWPLALAIVLAGMAAAGYLVRHQERRRRRAARRGVANLQRHMAGFLEDRNSAAELRRAARAAAPGDFWSALETLVLPLSYVQWLKLSRALEGVAAAADERRFLRHDSPWRRALAARRLGLLRAERSRRTLRRALRRGPEMVAVAALRALARYRDRGALVWLLRHPECAAGRSHPQRVALLLGFGDWALPEILAGLEGGLKSLRMERAAIEVLGLRGHGPARPAIEARLASPEEDLRAGAARALGRLRAPESAAVLLTALEDEAWSVRAQAARALGRLRATGAVAALAARLTDPAWWVRHHIAYALGEIGEAGLATLRHVAAHSADRYAREMAEEVLDGGFPAANLPRHPRVPRAAS